MNFLEKLVSEWYEYQGFFCRTNIRFGKTGHGGHIGEMDVVAFHPTTKAFVHIECSTDSWSWEEKKRVFITKFRNATRYYDEYFPFHKKTINQIAITGFSRPRKNDSLLFGKGIDVKLVPVFVAHIAKDLSKKDPWSVGINESSFPLLRAIQFGTYYLQREEKKEKKMCS